MCEERLSGILRTHQPGLDVIAGPERITERMGIRIAEVAVAVAFPPVERNAGGEQQRVFRMGQNVFQGWEGPLFHSRGDTYEIGKKLPSDSVQGLDQGEFAQCPHAVVPVDVGLEFLDLFRRQERDALQILPGSRVERNRMCRKSRQDFKVLFPHSLGFFTGGIEFVIQFFPVAGLLCGRCETGKSKEEGQ